MRDAPLREGLILLAGLGLLAWPLSLVTGKAERGTGQTVAMQTETNEWVTDVEVLSAHDFEWVELRRGEEVLGRVEGPAKEGEFECHLAEHGEILIVAAAYPEGTPETALQWKLWPGSLPEVVFTKWVEGELLEEVEVDFHE